MCRYVDVTWARPADLATACFPALSYYSVISPLSRGIAEYTAGSDKRQFTVCSI